MSNERGQSGVVIVLGGIVLLIAGLVYVLTHKTQAVPPIPNPDPDPPKASDSTTINFYLDGSGSIKHFLTTTVDADGHPLKNYMKELLDKAGTTLSNPPSEVGWKGKVNFLKFGTKIDPIPDNDPHTMSLHPEDFNAGNTSIEVPILDQRQGEEVERNPEVKIIVTDLYENGGRIEFPAKALASNYLSSEKDPNGRNAVDILAVRNPFDGQVQDLPGSAKGAVIRNAANTMPFYVIVAGPTADVRHVMSVLLSGTGLADAKKNDSATEFLFTRTPLPHRTDEMKLGGSGHFSGGDFPGRKIPLISLQSGTMEMRWDNSVKPSEGAVNLYGRQDNQQLRTTVLMPPVNTPGGSSDSPAWVELPDGSNAIDDCTPADLLCKSIDRSKLPKEPRTYILRFDRVVKERTTALDPDSPDLHKWNIEEADAEVISHTPPNKNPHFENMRGLTPDLSKFLNALEGQMFRSPVPVTSYYVYLQAN
ncbi:hypothetical protein [Granulicella arctica]|uniref:hypothetical protein n=1 Tax=Granulicella arctica TaxID=940613 RepID=UPI0021DF764E|nr:hypothetical protein [Granulicella arctica]